MMQHPFTFLCASWNVEKSLPEGCEFLSKRALSTAKASGLKNVRRFRILPTADIPMYSHPGTLPCWCFSSASFSQRSRTGRILAALRGVISSFSNLQMADWEYAGPSVALKACPTWVCVSPRTRRRILKVRANSRISSKSIPSTMLEVDCFIVGWPGREDVCPKGIVACSYNQSATYINLQLNLVTEGK